MQNASIEEKVDVNASMTEISHMSSAQAQVIIQKLKAERNILSTLANCLLALQFKDINDKQRRSLTHLIRIQASMVGLEVPEDE
ncbi:hypothetical protein [Alteromonas sp. C1M14]|uniref:hypothetical protein n=1 Tax=Alteromonas sp. C1M14 TaxID=2841567 RepID=UPI001C09E9C6|nr:hypothetical protein [Alteromonas sp. C1M14]MBU2979037.1 hypothetical protein [Alteromonas sp. C1M14]